MAERYDVAIIGTGPAGLSAAITLKIRNKKIILFGSKQLSTKVEKAHEIQNYLGIPAVKGEDLAKAFLRHLQQMEIDITEETITTAYDMGNYYGLLSKTNQMYEADAVILATGVSFGKSYPGEDEFLGRGVSYCATCDAPLYRGKKVAIIGESPREEGEVNFMSEIAEEVYYIPLYTEEPKVNDKVVILKEKPQGIQGEQMAEKLVLEKTSLEVDGVFILREAVSPAKLVPGLAMDGSHIQVNRSMETNLRGCFACGDIVGAPYQYIKAAGEGNVAAISAVKYLDQLS